MKKNSSLLSEQHWAKKPSLVKQWALISLAVSILLVSSGAAAQLKFERIIIFGTSLSDPGNVFALTGQSSTPPYDMLDPLLIPTAPYAQGGHHFSNGATWIEQLARALGLAKSARPAFQEPRDIATNYAVGGARARDSGDSINLSAQVNTFLQDFNGVAPSNALYVMEMGVNDVHDALSARDNTLITAALAAIRDNIEILHEAGAHKFLVVNAPNLGLLPAIRQLSNAHPGVIPVAEAFTQMFNLDLAKLVAQMIALFPKIEITQLDVYGKLQDLVATPAAFGLSEVERACITPNTPPFACQRPDKFLFWDGIHPTQAVHGIFSHEAAFALTRCEAFPLRGFLGILSYAQARHLCRFR